MVLFGTHAKLHQNEQRNVQHLWSGFSASVKLGVRKSTVYMFPDVETYGRVLKVRKTLVMILLKHNHQPPDSLRKIFNRKIEGNRNIYYIITIVHFCSSYYLRLKKRLLFLRTTVPNKHCLTGRFPDGREKIRVLQVSVEMSVSNVPTIKQ